MSKQTAVEWLIDRIVQDQLHKDISNKVWLELFEQAKVMEKEQIEDAYWEGGQDIPTTEQRCQDYFNQTYGGDK
jgi:hypothetical protein